MQSVVFVVGFSLIFLLTYHPFSSTVWIGLGSDVLLPSILFYLSAIGILLISKIGLMLYQLVHTVTVRKYLFFCSSTSSSCRLQPTSQWLAWQECS